MKKVTSRRFVKIGQAAKFLGVSIQTLRRWDESGRLSPVTTPGGTRLYSWDQLRQLGPKVEERTEDRPASQNPVELSQKIADEPIRLRNGSVVATAQIFSRPPPMVETPPEEGPPPEPPPKIESKPVPRPGRFLHVVPAVLAAILMVFSFGLNIYINTYEKNAESFRQAAANKPAGKFGGVLAAATDAKSLDLNIDTTINGATKINGATDIVGDTSIDGNANITGTLTAGNFKVASLTLTATTKQITLGTGKQITLPDANTTLVGIDNTQTLSNKSMSGSSNTFSNIPNSALTNSKVTVTPGTNLSGGGDIALGSSVTLNVKDSPTFASVAATTVYVNGDATISGNLMPAADTSSDIGSPTFYWNNLYVKNFVGASTGTSGYWQRAGGALAPANITDDFLLGGSSTAAAKFRVNGLTGAITASGGLSINSGDINFTGSHVIDATGTLGIGTATQTSLTLGRSGAPTVINGSSITFDGALINGAESATFSGSLGVGKDASFSAKITLDSATPQINAVSNRNLQLGFMNTGGIQFLNANNYIDASNNLTLAGLAANNAVLYSDATGTVKAVAPNAGAALCLTQTSSGVPTWGTCGGGGGDNYWAFLDGVVSPYDATETLVVGGSATASAKIYFEGTSGNASFSGQMGLGTTNTPLARLDVRGFNGTLPVASFSGTTAMAAMIVNNNLDSGDIFTASASGLPRFVITNAGNVGIGTTNPTSPLTVAGAGSLTNLNLTNNTNQIVLGTTNTGTLTMAALTGTHVWTLPNNTGEICTTFGNCIGGGSGAVGGGGTSGTIARFTPDGSHIGDSSITDTGTAATASGNFGVGGEASVSGKLILGSATPQINAVNNRDLQLGFQNTGTIQFLNATNYIDANNNLYLGGNLVNGGAISGFWQRNSGVVSPTNITDSLIIGSSATGSGQIQFYGLNGTNPVASISGRSSQAAMIIDNTIGDLFTASASGLNRFVITNAGFVGIGMSNPTYSLDVTGNARISNGLTVSNGITANNLDYSGIMTIGTTNQTSITLGQAASPTIINGQTVTVNGAIFKSDSTASISGAVTVYNTPTIQTTAMQDLLIGGTTTGGVYLSPNNSTGLYVDGSGNVRLSGLAASSAIYTDSNKNLTTTAPSSGGIGFWQRNGTVLSPTTLTDQVGIGTTVPGAGLGVLYNGTTPVATIAGRTSFAALQVDNTLGDLFSASASGLNRFVITNAGNVGIGAAAPTAILQINSALTGTNYLDVQQSGSSLFTVSDVSIANNLPTSFTAAGDVSIAYDINFTNVTSSNILSAAPLTVTAGENFNSSSLTLQTYNTGSVIVNSQAFNVLYAATVSGQLSVGTSSATPNIGNFYLTNNATYGKALMMLNQMESADLFTASASGTTKFVINASGQVGIGTASPGNALDVRGLSGTTPVASISGTTAQATMIVNNNLNSGDIFTASASGLNRFVITNAGNVGIGTTAPTLGLLDLQSTFGTIPVASITGRTAYAALTVNNNLDSGDIFTASASGLNRFVITNAGRVGIGTTNPSHYLDVAGNFVVTSSGYVGIGTTGPNAPLEIYNGVTGQDTLLKLTNYYGAANNTSDIDTRIGGIASTVNSRISTIRTDRAVALDSDLTFSVTSNSSLTERMRIKDNGNVGIGTTAPTATLDIRGNSGTTPAASVSGTTAMAAMIVNNNLDSGPIFTASASGLARFTVNNDGTISIPALADGSLSVSGGIITSASDIRKKDVIGGLGPVLDSLMQINPVYFTWKEGTPEYQGDKRQIGLIAQNVQQYFPELVGTGANGMLGMNYNYYTAVLTKGIQEQQGEIATVSAQLDQLSTDISGKLSLIPTIQDEIASISAQMASVSGRLAKVEGAPIITSTSAATDSATLADAVGQILSSSSTFTTSQMNVATLSAEFGRFSDSLTVVGHTNLADTTIGGSLTVGLLRFDDLKADLSSLTGTLSLQGGMLTVDSYGNASVAGEMKARTVNTTGITLKDTATGQPYCLQVTNGEIVKTAGKCQ